MCFKAIETKPRCSEKGQKTYRSAWVSSREVYWCGMMFILKCFQSAFHWLYWCRAFSCSTHRVCMCVKVCITSDNFLTDEYWVLTFLWIRVSVLWVQQENLKVGQCLQSRFRLLHFVWSVCIWLVRVYVWPQVNCKCRTWTKASVPSLLTVISETPPPPSDVIFFPPSPTFRKMCLKETVAVCCALCPRGSGKIGVPACSSTSQDVK